MPFKSCDLADLQKHITYDPASGELAWTGEGRKHKTARADLATKSGYRFITFKAQRFPAHRVAWALFYGKWPEQCIDHIDGSRDNNRIGNLRDVSHAENIQGARRLSPRNKSGITGVTWNKAKNCWQASISRNGKSKFLGLFSTVEAAAEARKNHESIPDADPRKYRKRI